VSLRPNAGGIAALGYTSGAYWKGMVTSTKVLPNKDGRTSTIGVQLTQDPGSLSIPHRPWARC